VVVPDPIVDQEPPATATPGFPGAHNTGVPDGTVLRSHRGDLTITTPGAVIDSLDIDGCVRVNAPRVKITRSRITCGGPHSIRVLDAGAGVVIEDSEIDGTAGEVTAAVCCSRYTLRRVDVHGVIDGPRVGTDTVIEDSWIHDLKRVPGSHNDALQTQGGDNIVIRGNNLQAYNARTGDPMNAALQVGALMRDLTNMVVENNLMNGGNYTISAGDGSSYRISNFVIRNNSFGRDFRYGIVKARSATTLWTGNAWLDNGISIRG
jgi:hypothetical protein